MADFYAQKVNIYQTWMNRFAAVYENEVEPYGVTYFGPNSKSESNWSRTKKLHDTQHILNFFSFCRNDRLAYYIFSSKQNVLARKLQINACDESVVSGTLSRAN